jgi:hypothetical protein
VTDREERAVGLEVTMSGGLGPLASTPLLSRDPDHSEWWRDPPA